MNPRDLYSATPPTRLLLTSCDSSSFSLPPLPSLPALSPGLPPHHCNTTIDWFFIHAWILILVPRSVSFLSGVLLPICFNRGPDASISLLLLRPANFWPLFISVWSVANRHCHTVQYYSLTQGITVPFSSSQLGIRALVYCPADINPEQGLQVDHVEQFQPNFELELNRNCPTNATIFTRRILHRQFGLFSHSSSLGGLTVSAVASLHLIISSYHCPLYLTVTLLPLKPHLITSTRASVGCAIQYNVFLRSLQIQVPEGTVKGDF